MGKIDPIERAVRKIESIMRKERVNKLTIERKYLPEIFSAEMLIISKDDGLPSLKLSALQYFKFLLRGLEIKYYGNVIIFFKSIENIPSLPNVDAMVMVSKEGLPIASALSQAIDESKIAAISASLISLGEKSITEMKKGKFDHIYIKSSDGYLLAMQAGSEAILTVSTTKDARLGLLILDCKRTCDKIANLVNREI